MFHRTAQEAESPVSQLKIVEVISLFCSELLSRTIINGRSVSNRHMYDDEVEIAIG